MVDGNTTLNTYVHHVMYEISYKLSKIHDPFIFNGILKTLYIVVYIIFTKSTVIIDIETDIFSRNFLIKTIVLEEALYANIYFYPHHSSNTLKEVLLFLVFM